MKTSRQIDHEGIIHNIKDGKITITILNLSACAGCHAKGACTMSDKKEKTIEVMDSSNQFKEGEKVNVVYNESLGWIAVFLAYILPFILVLTTMFITSVFTSEELYIGGLGLLVLLPFYIILNLLKKHLNRTFSFTIQKIA